jgi:hypothetical protein
MATETKTMPPKTDTNPFTGNPAFDPIAIWNASQQAFTKVMTDAYGRAQSFADQYAALEHQMVERAKMAIQNWSQLCQDAITYGAHLSAEARKISFETARKVGIGN